MTIDLLVEGEGLAEIAVISVSVGTDANDIIGRVAELTGIDRTGAFLFVEDADVAIEIGNIRVDEAWSGVVHHVHRVARIEVVVFYNGGERRREFSPSTRVQRVLDWAVGPKGFNIDPVIAPEMALARAGSETPLPNNAHIGRFVRHPAKHLELDLIRGVVPNGSAA